MYSTSRDASSESLDSDQRATGRLLSGTLAVTIFLCLLGLLATGAEAGGFLTPLEDFPFTEGTVVTTDGRILVGEVRLRLEGFRGFKKIAVIDREGTKHRLRATEVRSILAPLDEASRAIMALQAVTTIEKAIETDWEKIRETEGLVYDALAWPEADRRIIVQRLNPGFDTAIQVYHLGNAREYVWKFKGIPIAGDQEKAFLVMKNGEGPIKIKKRAYEDEFFTLFADCPEVLASLEDDDADFEDFADHVALYDRTCGLAANPAAVETAMIEMMAAEAEGGELGR